MYFPCAFSMHFQESPDQRAMVKRSLYPNTCRVRFATSVSTGLRHEFTVLFTRRDPTIQHWN